MRLKSAVVAGIRIRGGSCAGHSASTPPRWPFRSRIGRRAMAAELPNISPVDLLAQAAKLRDGEDHASAPLVSAVDLLAEAGKLHEAEDRKRTVVHVLYRF